MEYLLESEVLPLQLTFMAKKEKQESYFDVINRGEMHQIYKIKTNNVKGYKIKPAFFSLGVNERMRVFVDYLGLTDKPSKDRISVVYAHRMHENLSVKNEWKLVEQLNSVQRRAYIEMFFHESSHYSLTELDARTAAYYAPRTTKTRKPPQPQDEEEEEALLPPPKPVAPKPRSKVDAPPPSRPVNEDDEETRLNAKKVASPVRTTRSKSPNPKQKTRKNSKVARKGKSKVDYVIQQHRNDEEKEESDKKTRKKNKGMGKKSSKRRQEEDDEDKE